MTTHLGLQRIMIPSAQVSQLTTGSITLPSARTAFVNYSDESLTLLGSFSLTSGTPTTIEVTNIPQTYKHLYIRATAQGMNSISANSFSSSGQNIFNGDTGTNYGFSEYYFWITGTSANGGSDSTDEMMNIYTPGNSDSRNNAAVTELYIRDYRSTTNYKNYIFNNGFRIDADSGSATRDGIFNFGAGEYKTLNPITSFSMVNTTNSFRANTSIFVYGYGDGS
jgi:hypothetical protein